MAAATVMRLQTIVSRELAAAEAAVVTVGSLQAGTKENVIPEEAVIKLNVRSFDEGVRKRVLAAISGSSRPRPRPRAPPAAGDHAARPLSPGGKPSRGKPARRRCVPPALFRRAGARDRTGAGERGFRIVRRGVARALCLLVCRRHRPRALRESQGGGPAQRDPDQPQSAPIIHPTLQTGVEALVVAARAWLAP
jgi:hypothetical protein